MENNEVCSNLIKYIENAINFSFIAKIPGYDKEPRVQKEALIRLIQKFDKNESFLEFATYTLTTLQSGIITQIIPLTWSKPNGMKDSFINDDKFGLSIDEIINYISVLLIVKDIMHTSYIASLPIYNSYRYNQKEFYNNVIELIENAVDNISTLESINPIFLAIAAKSILPFSIRDNELSASSKLIAILFNVSRIMASYPNTETNVAHTQPIFISTIYNLVNNASFLGLDYKMANEFYDKVKSGDIKWKN